MSVTHPDVGFTTTHQPSFAEQHPQLTPALVAVVIFAVSVAVALAVTGLPA